MFGARSVTGVTPLSMGVFGRVVRLPGTTVTLLEGIMVRLPPDAVS